MKLGVFMLWTEMREIPKETVPLTTAPAGFDRALADGEGRAPADKPKKRHRASVIVDEITSA